MTADLRSQVIRRTVAELVAFEGEVAGRLERAQQLSSGHPDALAAIQRLRPMVQRHRDQLTTYLKECGGAEPSGEMTSPLSASRESNALSEALRDLCLAFHNCALGYAMLFEVALRLYEPRLREIAPRHLKAHTDATLLTARLLPGVVAWQLAQDGLHCACICPMCGLGACGCVALWHPNTDRRVARRRPDRIRTDRFRSPSSQAGKRAGAGRGARRRTGPRR